MAHTPIPWHVGTGNGRHSIFAADGRMRLEEGGTCLYPIATVQQGWLEDEANAEFIVKAVNSHDQLLAALTAIVRVAETASLPGPVPLSIAEFNEARDAIKEAE